ncbi:MAG: coenzyme F420-0:L-glutamate ligase [Acidobacteria bacterium]|nr:coenzyme F420-0:L-glutamate ligase [Acidobacteriota bacterium]
MTEKLEIFAISGLPEISTGDSLSELIWRAVLNGRLAFADGDVLVVAQKIVSKAEGRLVELSRVEPSLFARSAASSLDKDARQIEVILRESKRIVRMEGGVLIAETHHGLVCANAGVDASNVPPGWVSLLPQEPDASAERLRSELAEKSGKRLAVIVSDTFGRPWREGLTNLAIGLAGMKPLLDYRGERDGQGHLLTATVIAVGDELAAAAELVMGKASHRPVAVVRGFCWKAEMGTAAELIRPKERDLFR